MFHCNLLSFIIRNQLGTHFHPCDQEMKLICLLTILILSAELASLLKVKRLGVMGRTQSNGYRQPTVRLLLGSNGWTDHVDNGVT